MGRRVKRRVQRAGGAAAGPGLAVALVAEVEIRAPRAVPPDAEHRGFIAPIAGELGELRAGGRRPYVCRRRSLVLRRRGSPEGTAHPGPAVDGFAPDSRRRLGRRRREEASGVPATTRSPASSRATSSWPSATTRNSPSFWAPSPSPPVVFSRTSTLCSCRRSPRSKSSSASTSFGFQRVFQRD